MSSSKSNGANTGSDNEPNNARADPNKERRIRLKNKDIQIIDEALAIYYILPENSPHDPEDIQKLITRIYERKKLDPRWIELSDLRRRFSCLAEDDGFYARRSR